MFHLQGTPAIIRMNLTLPETTVTGLHFRRHSMGLSLFIGKLRKCMYFETECVTAVHGHSRSLILVPIESANTTSYWSSTVTLVLSCPVSEILQVFLLKIATPPLFHKYFMIRYKGGQDYIVANE